MKHILNKGYIIFGSPIINGEYKPLEIETVLTQWAEETGYEGSLSELPIHVMSAADLIHFEYNRKNSFQPLQHFENLLSNANEIGMLVIITNFDEFHIENRLSEEYHKIFKEQFHVMDIY